MFLLPSTKSVKNAQKPTGQSFGDRNAMDVVAFGPLPTRFYNLGIANTSGSPFPNVAHSSTLTLATEKERIVMFHVVLKKIQQSMVFGVGGGGGFLSNDFLRFVAVPDDTGYLNQIITYSNWTLETGGNRNAIRITRAAGSAAITTGEIRLTIGTVPA